MLGPPDPRAPSARAPVDTPRVRVDGCDFCAVIAGEKAAHLVYRDELVMAFLDRAPLLRGHTLVVPVDHYETLEDLPDDLVAPFFILTRRLSVAFGSVFSADGSFLGVNTRISQSVPHLHAHVVPRTKGDGLFSRRMSWQRLRYEDGEAERVAADLRAALGLAG